ncbi:myosin heavy chain, clone 203-like [Penaeus vannamei]|uniref:myosin heavy chain, clone 203-like n=1 Tax=Penaeus vannamei TaxID=6689 RepID=UPI00387FA8D4
MKLAEAAVRIEALEAKVDNLVAECLKIREENVNLKELVENLRRNTIQRENMEKSDLKIKELKQKLEEAETKIGNGSETEAKNLHEKVEEVIKVQETVEQIESNLSNSQAQIMEAVKKMTATYADVSKVKETVNEMEKRKEKRNQDHKGVN